MADGLVHCVEKGGWYPTHYYYGANRYLKIFIFNWTVYIKTSLETIAQKM